MTDPEQPSVEKPPTIHHDADYVVEQAVERAAVKVAAAVPTSNGQSELLSKMGSITAVAIIVIVGLANFVLNLQTQNKLSHHQKDFKAICQIIVEQAPPESAKDLALKLTECLN